MTVTQRDYYMDDVTFERIVVTHYSDDSQNDRTDKEIL